MKKRAILPPPWWPFPKYWSSNLFIKPKQKFNPRQLAPERLRPVTQIHSLVERRVCAHQVGRHGHGVVQIGKAATRVFGAGVEDGLRGFFDFLFLGGRGRKREGEIVVNEGI